MTRSNTRCLYGADRAVTIDEDGQHNPSTLGNMLDTVIADRADVVYASGLNLPFVRNAASRIAKVSVRWLTGNSYMCEFQQLSIHAWGN